MTGAQGVVRSGLKIPPCAAGHRIPATANRDGFSGKVKLKDEREQVSKNGKGQTEISLF